MAGKNADKDILEPLAALEFAAEMEAGDDDADGVGAQGATTFRRILREAGYELPPSFDWQDHLKQIH